MVNKSPKSPITSFPSQLSCLADVKKVDILLRDFNGEALCNEAYAGIDNFLTEYVLMVTEHAHLDEELLDYLYFWKQFLIGKHAKYIIYISQIMMQPKLVFRKKKS